MLCPAKVRYCRTVYTNLKSEYDFTDRPLGAMMTATKSAASVDDTLIPRRIEELLIGVVVWYAFDNR